MKTLICLLALLAAPALSQTPGLFDRPAKTLDLRENPRATARVIGTLDESQTLVEGTRQSENGRWLQILFGEGNAWIPFDGLTPVAAPASRFDAPLFCAGTEPFWSLNTPGDGILSYEVLGQTGTKFQVVEHISSANRPDTQADRALGKSTLMTLVLRTAACSDGMSDRDYGLSTEVMLRTIEGTQLLGGCCTLKAP